MDPIVIGATVSAVSVGILYAIVSSEPPSISTDGKYTIAAYGRVVKGVGAVVTAVLVLITIREYFDRSDDRDVLLLLIITTLAGGTYLLCEAFRTRFEYDKDRLHVTTAFKQQRTFQWTDVVDISYSHWRSAYLLAMRDGTRLAVSEYLAGSNVLMDFARRRKSQNLKNR